MALEVVIWSDLEEVEVELERVRGVAISSDEQVPQLSRERQLQ